MPTYETTATFLRQYGKLTRSQQAAFRRAIGRFVEDLHRGTIRPGLRVKGIQALPGCFEITWHEDGRAIFTYGPEIREGEPHIIWLAIGTHSVLP